MGRASDDCIELSIILPVFNADKEIYNCLNNMTMALDDEMELIIVNDGSEDNTQEIVERFLSGRDITNITLENKKNGGVSSARNLGIEVARGKYIGFMDVDDIVAPNMYKNLLDKAKEGSLDVVCCDFHEVSGGRIVNSKYKYRNEALSSREVVKHYLLDKVSNSVCDKIFKRSLVSKIKFNESLTIGEDILFCLQIFMRADRVGFLSKDLYGYVQNDNSVMHSKIDKFEQYNQVIEHLSDEDRKKIQKIYPEEFEFFKLEMAVRTIHAISMVNTSKKKKRRALKNALEHVNISDILMEKRFPKSVRMEMRLLKTFGLRFHLAVLPMYKLVRKVLR